MASCALCQKGLRKKFVALRNCGEYLRFSDGGRSYFSSLGDLATYERFVQLDVASTLQVDMICALNTRNPAL